MNKDPFDDWFEQERGSVTDYDPEPEEDELDLDLYDDPESY